MDAELKSLQIDRGKKRSTEPSKWATRWIVGGGDYVLAMGRHLGHKTESLGGRPIGLHRRLAAKGTPSDHVFIPDGHLLANGDQRVQALVVLGAVHIQSECMAIAREGMAVGASRQT